MLKRKRNVLVSRWRGKLLKKLRREILSQPGIDSSLLLQHHKLLVWPLRHQTALLTTLFTSLHLAAVTTPMSASCHVAPVATRKSASCYVAARTSASCHMAPHRSRRQPTVTWRHQPPVSWPRLISWNNQNKVRDIIDLSSAYHF